MRGCRNIMKPAHKMTDRQLLAAVFPKEVIKEARKIARAHRKPTSFQREVKRWRKKRGLSMAAAARELGVPYVTWQTWEYGRHEPRGLACQAIIEKLTRS